MNELFNIGIKIKFFYFFAQIPVILFSRNPYVYKPLLGKASAVNLYFRTIIYNVHF